MSYSSRYLMMQLSESTVSRRTLLKRAAIGVGGAAFLPLLAACAEDDDAVDDDDAPTVEDPDDEEAEPEVDPDDEDEEDVDEPVDDDEEEDAPADGDGVFGGRFTAAVDISITHLDIQTSSDTMTRIIGNHMYETLLAYGEDYAVVPRLAEAWEMSDDGTVCTLNLRDDVLYHNGDQMVADDVVASIERYMDYGARGVLSDFVETATDPDDHTIEIQLLQPEYRFIDILASPSIGMHIQPRAIIEGKAVEELAPDEYIGTGPYKLDEFISGEEVLMSRFDDYYEPEGEPDGYGGAKPAYFDEIRWLVVPETGARVSGLLPGNTTTSGISQAPNAPGWRTIPKQRQPLLEHLSGGVLVSTLTRMPA